MQVSIDHFDYISKQVVILHFDHFIKHLVTAISHFLNTADVTCHLTDQSITILCPEDLETASAIAENIIHAINNQPYSQSDTHIEFTISIGITPINEDSTATATAQILTQVEQATSQAQAQSQGSNQVHHYCIKAGVDVIAGALEDPKTLTILWSWGIRYF